MSSRLAGYIDDHLAGAAIALEILASLEHAADLAEWRPTVTALRREVEEDVRTLLGLRQQLSSPPVGWKRRVARWVGRMMRRRFSKDRLGTFEAVEALALGVHGKDLLWEALEAVGYPAARKMDFAGLRRRAQSQFQVLVKLRLALARPAFT
ncbi:MAG TPA: hypothetical protein VM029_12635 [Opitutaceae bacterium]|nr:hypothetical protein [Opitutaceae bacterium]